MEIFWVKFCMLWGLFAIGISMGLSPLIFNRVSPHLRLKLLSYGNCFAGGVLLSIGFLHLLAESAHLVEEAISIELLNIAYAVCLIGFLFVFFIEKVLFAETHSHTHIDQDRKESQYGTGRGPVVESASLLVEPGENVPPKSAVVFVTILTLVLGIHSFISGMVLGMLDDLDLLLAIFVAIVSHKWIEAFALGAAIVKVDTRKLKLFLYISVYSLCEPLGVVAGIILSFFLSEEATQTTQAVVLSFASGTFIYIASLDIIPQEFSDHSQNKLLKFTILVAGAALMCGFALGFEDTH